MVDWKQWLKETSTHTGRNGSITWYRSIEILRELKRGRTRQITSDHTYYDYYLADAAARVIVKTENTLGQKHLGQRKKSQGYIGIDTFVHTYRRNHHDERVS